MAALKAYGMAEEFPTWRTNAKHCWLIARFRSVGAINMFCFAATALFTFLICPVGLWISPRLQLRTPGEFHLNYQGTMENKRLTSLNSMFVFFLSHHMVHFLS